ncbi:MAG: tRNA (adenosine(37)-N6)-threonylcarbamoyltransferase complex dimerization subunit type 1 TsaB [Thermoanaerobaculia bacterium]
MRLLAIDTATPRPSLALVVDGSEPWTVELPQKGAEALAPAVTSLLASAGVSPRDLDRIAVVSGPGSFTGLRSSLAFARGLARAAGCLLVPLPTFEVVSGACPEPPDADLLLDALRGEVHRRRRRQGRLAPAEDRVTRSQALEDAARDGVPALDVDSLALLLASAAADLASVAVPDGTADLLYGRPPAAEERFGPGGSG